MLWGGSGAGVPRGGSGAGVPREFEKGVLDIQLLVVLFDELRRDDCPERPPLAWGVAPSGGCLEARDSPCWGLVATGELGWAVPGTSGHRLPGVSGPEGGEVVWPSNTEEEAIAEWTRCQERLWPEAGRLPSASGNDLSEHLH